MYIKHVIRKRLQLLTSLHTEAIALPDLIAKTFFEIVNMDNATINTFKIMPAISEYLTMKSPKTSKYTILPAACFCELLKTSDEAICLVSANKLSPVCCIVPVGIA